MKEVLLYVASTLSVLTITGVIYYYNTARKLKKEFMEFISVAFQAMEDKKLTIKEKDALLKEWADVTPIVKELKDRIIADVKEISEKTSDKYDTIKENVKE